MPIDVIWSCSYLCSSTSGNMDEQFNMVQFHGIEELLISASFQILTTRSSDKRCETAVCYGSGFMVRFRNYVLFVTADHNLHPDDYDQKPNLRTGNDYQISIFNNVKSEDNFYSTLITPLGSFYFAEKFSLHKLGAPTLVDTAVSIIEERQRQYPFYNPEIKGANGFEIPYGTLRTIIPQCHFALPDTDEKYFVCGYVRWDDSNGMIMKRDFVFHKNMIYRNDCGDYHRLEPSQMITDESDWSGLSGSPVIDSKGRCIGVMCSVDKKANSVYVKSIGTVEILLELAINEHEGLLAKKDEIK